MRAGILSQSRHPAQEQAFSLSSSLPPAHERLPPNARPQAPHRPNYGAELAVATGKRGIRVMEAVDIIGMGAEEETEEGDGKIWDRR